MSAKNLTKVACNPTVTQDESSFCDVLPVTRLTCRLAEEGYEMGLDIDINSDLFPLENNDLFVHAASDGVVEMSPPEFSSDCMPFEHDNPEIQANPKSITYTLLDSTLYRTLSDLKSL